MNPTREEIAKKAYEIWERKGRPADSDYRNWIAAWAELAVPSSPPPSYGSR